jgi:SAM-dependent methyltransferase
MNNQAQDIKALAQHAAKLLHVGCGTAPRERLPKVFQQEGWLEIRYDIDAQVRPHIIGSATNMSVVPNACIDAVWSSHNVEHLHSFEVPLALAEFRRVLKPSGFALLSVPDMKAIADLVVKGGLNEMLYQSAAGPIRPLDMIFGHQASIQAGNQFMAHRSGFTAETLGSALLEAGFTEVRVHEGNNWDLWALATMPDTPARIFRELAEVMQ